MLTTTTLSHKLFTYAAALLAVSCLALSGCDDKKQQAPARPVPQVKTITVKPASVSTYVELTGRTSAFVVAEVRPQVSGIIQKKMFKEGTTVEAGQQLYQIDPAVYQAAYDSATANMRKEEANLAITKSLYDRYKAIIKVNGVSKQEYEDSQAKYRQAQANWAAAKAAAQSAKINLDYTKVFSPVTGRSGISSVTEGALVTAAQAAPLVYVQQMNPMYVDITQSSVEYLRLKRSLQSGKITEDENSVTVTITLEDDVEYDHKATLMLYDETIDQGTGSITLRAKVDNPEGLLMPGMYVRAKVYEGTTNNALLVPQQAVQRNQQGQPVVLVVNNADVVESRVITTNRVYEGSWVVMPRAEAEKASGNGLDAGDRIIMEGSLKVRAGSPAMATPYTAPAASGNTTGK